MEVATLYIMMAILHLLLLVRVQPEPGARMVRSRRAAVALDRVHQHGQQ
jgi:hypothetical protein